MSGIGRDEALEKWYELYQGMRDDEAIKAADEDVLDDEDTERLVKEFMPGIQIQDGYCTTCQDFLKKWLRRCRIQNKANLFCISWHDEFVRFEAGSRQGCAFCRLFMRNINQGDLQKARKIEGRLQRLGRECSLKIHTHFNDLGESLILLFPGQPKGYDIIMLRWNLTLIQGVPKNFSHSFSGDGSITQIEAGRSSLDTPKIWLTRCSTSHTLCNMLRKDVLPSRLLKLDENSVKLVLTKDLTTKPHYATLSHCWGKSKFITLTQKLLESYMTRVPIGEAPKTFQDAVFITRELGIEYLWIDSLCIIQDSDKDWVAESALMGSVYSNSRITIAAAAAHDGTVGCLVQPPDGLGSRAHVERVTDDGNTTYIFVPNGLHSRAVTKSPLASRAWAFQERILSPRILHFGPDELLWECKEKAACESFPETLPATIVKVPDDTNQWKLPLYDIWPAIIYRYSDAKLTYGKDKLVALSGIVRAAKDEIVRSGVDDECIAGMWRRNLATQLWWKIDPRSWSARPSPDRAPSWSWASVDGLVSYPSMNVGDQNVVQYAHVLDVRVTPIGPDPFGQIRGGVLRLGCKYMLLGRHAHRRVFVSLPRGKVKFRVHIDTKDDVDKSGGMVYMIPIARIIEDKPLYSIAPPDAYLKGIVVRPMNAEKGQYSRVGSFSFSAQKVSTGMVYGLLYEEFSQAMLDLGTETARAACAEVITGPEESFVLNII